METQVTLTIKKVDWMQSIYRSNVIEEEKEAIAENKSTEAMEGKEVMYAIAVKPYEIATFGLRPKEQ